MGTHAARMAIGLGTEMIMLDHSIPRLRELELFEGRSHARFPTMEGFGEEVLAVDVGIGAVLVSGESAPNLISRGMLNSMIPEVREVHLSRNDR